MWLTADQCTGVFPSGSSHLSPLHPTTPQLLLLLLLGGLHSWGRPLSGHHDRPMTWFLSSYRMSTARTSSRLHRMPKAVREWQVGLVSLGLWCRARAEQPTHPHTHPDGCGEAEEGDRGPSVQVGFSVPHFSAFPGDGRPALQIHIPQIPGEAGPGPGPSRRPRPLPAGLLGGDRGESFGMPQRWLRVAEPCPLRKTIFRSSALVGSPRARGTPQHPRASPGPATGWGRTGLRQRANRLHNFDGLFQGS